MTSNTPRGWTGPHDPAEPVVFPEVLDLMAPLRWWFAVTPRWSHWVSGPAILWGCWDSWQRSMQLPEPGQPQVAFIFTLVLAVAVFVASELMKPKPKIEDARPSGAGDFSLPTASEGRPVPIIFGRRRLEGPNMLDFGGVDQVPIMDSIRYSLLKSKKQFIKGYQYRAYLQFGICRGGGENVTLRKVWIGEDEVFSGTVSGVSRFDIDLPTLFGGLDDGNGGVQATCDFFPGTKTQAVSAFLNVADRQIISGVTTTAPRYTGTSHLVVRELTSADATGSEVGAYIGNRDSIVPWRFELERWSSIFAGQSAGQNVIDSEDSNPVNVIYEVLTNREWGLGFAASDVDTGASSTFLAASDTMIAEANGFSFIMDRKTEALEFLREIERQIDGLVFQDPNSGKFVLKLARGGYTLAAQPLVDESNSEFSTYTVGTWEDTTNQVNVQYAKRSDVYKTAYAMAQDMANMLIRGAGTVTTGKIVTATANFPGVTRPALAVNIAWRLLRTLAYPLARATFTLDRSFWDLTPVDVFRWRNTELGIVDLPMRVMSVDYGTLTDGKLTVEAVQDVFAFAAASSGTPPDTRWEEPSLAVTAYPTDEQLAEEAPRALVIRDPDYLGDPTAGKVWAAARRNSTETGYQIRQRNAAGTPAGSFGAAGDSGAFIRIGRLNADLDAGTAVPTATVVLKATPDTLSDLADIFTVGATALDLGQNLVNLLLVGSEFMAVTSAAVVGSTVELTDVYRGLLDSVQADHAEDDYVYLLVGGIAMLDNVFPNTNQVHVKLIPESRDGELAEGSATQIAFTMDKRAIRPYPPSAVEFNSAGSNFGTPSLEGAGSGLNGFRIDVEWWRKRFDTSDEVAELAADNTPDGSTEYEAELRYSPFSASEIIETKAWTTGTGGPEQFTRLNILAQSDQPAGSELELRITSRHDIGSETNLECRNPLVYRFTPTSSLSGQVYMGQASGSFGLPTAHTAAATGTYVVNIGAGYAASAVHYRINGGSWLTAIAAGGGTTGNIPGVSASDTIELRHETTEGGANFVELQNPSATAVAYGVFLS